MPEKKRKLSRRDRDYKRKSSKDRDILGCFKKNMENGVPITLMTAYGIPVRLHRRFMAAIQMNGDTKKRALMLFMEQYAVAVEKKFNIHLDPEFPAGYDPSQ